MTTFLILWALAGISVATLSDYVQDAREIGKKPKLLAGVFSIVLVMLTLPGIIVRVLLFQAREQTRIEERREKSR